MSRKRRSAQSSRRLDSARISDVAEPPARTEPRHVPRPFRLGPILVVAAVLFVAGGSLWWWKRAPAFTFAPDANRNVLLVTIDTLRADALSSYGGQAETPNLDHLAAGGARFTFAHAHAVVTLASHTTILTGRYPYEHMVRDNSGYRVPDGTVTIATRMKSLGFATGAFIGGFPLTKRFGLAPAFDDYDDQFSVAKGDVEFSMPERRGEIVVGRAVDWINTQPGKFFAWVHLFDPHAPYQPPAEYLAKYKSQPYYGEVAYADHALGPLFDRLAALSRPTLVIVTSDHGESLGEHGEETHGIFAYESTLHVPLIVAEIVPHTLRPTHGSVIDTPVRHVDIVPTILDSVGASADATLPGRSLREPILHGTDVDRPEYFEAMMSNVSRGWAPLRGVLVGRDKYIDLPIPELYDLQRDPHELKNEAAAQTDRLQVLSNTLRTYNVAPPNQPTVESRQVGEQLRALGYVSSGPQEIKDKYTEADDPKRLIGVDQSVHHAVDQFQTGHPKDAVATLLDVLKQEPKAADVYEALGTIYWEAGQPANAIAILNKALSLGVTGHQIPGRLGVYLAKTGQAPRAISLLEHLQTSDVDAINALGIAYGTVGRTADALHAFQHVLELDPTNGFAYQNIATVQFQQHQLADAEASLRRAIQVDPALPGAYSALGTVLMQSNRPADAIECWRSAVELNPRDFDSMFNLAVTLASTGRMPEAEVYGQRFLATAPAAVYGGDFARVHQLLGK